MKDERLLIWRHDDADNNVAAAVTALRCTLNLVDRLEDTSQFPELDLQPTQCRTTCTVSPEKIYNKKKMEHTDLLFSSAIFFFFKKISVHPVNREETNSRKASGAISTIQISQHLNVNKNHNLCN